MNIVQTQGFLHKWLMDHGPLTTPEIAKATEGQIDRNAIINCLNILEKKGLVRSYRINPRMSTLWSAVPIKQLPPPTPKTQTGE